MKKFVLISAVLFAIIFIFGVASAQTSYADITITLSQDGTATITGQTNDPLLEPQTTADLTTKEGELWSIELNAPQVFSEYIYKIVFPQNAEFIDTNTNSAYRISTEEGKIVMIGTGENIPLLVKARYKITNQQNSFQAQEFYFWILIIVLVAIILALAFLIGKKDKELKAGTAKTVPNQETKQSYNKEALTERQVLILELLQKKGNITQAEIKKQLGFPKAALSRNIKTLEKKGIIEKERKGMAMLITLKK